MINSLKGVIFEEHLEKDRLLQLEEISITSVVWTYDTFENYFEINHKLEKIFQGEFLIGF